MSKENMKELSKNYDNYVHSLKNIIKYSSGESDKNLLIEKLKLNTEKQEKKLDSYIEHLKCIHLAQEEEYLKWARVASELEQKKRILEMIIEQQSSELALSKAQLEHGLRMLSLYPSSTPNDYLKEAKIKSSATASIRSDWENVGATLAHSIIEKQKEKI